ncbi:hypothetical protein [Sphingobium sp. B12D2B]|uniref:hypothetical protein n=1 Tax=Sphingobium sp. B12D2B TaxID=2940577 RepID=UPI002224FB89|nr:hypothetical protein [Sphingobium sp. B12D2B]MCW2349801.1 hypothetical protein [Sphingobium sp. B12D2B]
MTSRQAAKFSSLTVILEDGFAEHMGGGIFVVRQRDDDSRKAFRKVVLETHDIEALMGSTALTVPLVDGRAEYAGDDLWVVYRTDELSGKPASVVLSRSDLVVMWKTSGQPQAVRDAAVSLHAVLERYAATVETRLA